MGNSITEYWALYHPDFFSEHHFIGSIPPCDFFMWNPAIQEAAQTIVEINARLRDYAKANGIVYVDYHSTLADEHNAFPKKLSDDGCHPNPDTYFIMEELVLKAIGEALK